MEKFLGLGLGALTGGGDWKGCHWKDTMVIDAIQCEAGVGESGKAITVQPSPQRDVLVGMREREKGNDAQSVSMPPSFSPVFLLPRRHCLLSIAAFNHSLYAHPVTPPLPSLEVQKKQNDGSTTMHNTPPGPQGPEGWAKHETLNSCSQQRVHHEGLSRC